MVDYRKLPLHAKQKHALDAARARPIRCPFCSTQVVEHWLAVHVARHCTGSLQARDAMLLSERRKELTCT